MKKTISFLRKGKAVCFILLTGVVFLLAASETNAQTNAQGMLNPYTHIANKLNVTAYPLGTFDRTHSMDVLQQILIGMKQIMSNGGNQSQRLKYNYLNRLLADINNNYIAVEISLLTSLSALTAENSSTEIQNAQLRNLYNEIVNQLD